MEKLTFKQKLLEAQKEIGAIKKDSDNPFFKSKYFDINAILAEVKPKLNKYGLIITQAIDISENRNVIKTIISDVDSDGYIVSVMYLPDLAKPQDMGSATTYYRRYALQSLLALEAEDDDGNVASGKVYTPEVKGGKITNKPKDGEVPF